MKIISKPLPGGRSWEYCQDGYELNTFKGCQHGCKYCFGAEQPWKSSAAYWRDPDMKSDPVGKLDADLSSRSIKRGQRIFISFLGDPYQPAETDTVITRQCLEVILRHGNPFTILTKGGTRAARDFDLYRSGDVFGTSLSFSDDASREQWEPLAAPVADRIDAIMQAKSNGIRTWISLEPVIDPTQALDVIWRYHRHVDRWSIGKINGKSTQVKAVSRSINWKRFYADVVRLLDQIGCKYQIKNDLLAAAGRHDLIVRPEPVKPIAPRQLCLI